MRATTQQLKDLRDALRGVAETLTHAEALEPLGVSLSDAARNLDKAIKARPPEAVKMPNTATIGTAGAILHTCPDLAEAVNRLAGVLEKQGRP